MSAAVHALPETAPAALPGAGSGLVHEVCCVDFDLAMCGTPVPGEGWADPKPVTCAVCADLLEAWAERADRYGDDLEISGVKVCRFCPKRMEACQ